MLVLVSSLDSKSSGPRSSSDQLLSPDLFALFKQCTLTVKYLQLLHPGVSNNNFLLGTGEFNARGR